MCQLCLLSLAGDREAALGLANAYESLDPLLHVLADGWIELTACNYKVAPITAGPVVLGKK